MADLPVSRETLEAAIAKTRSGVSIPGTSLSAREVLRTALAAWDEKERADRLEAALAEIAHWDSAGLHDPVAVSIRAYAADALALAAGSVRDDEGPAT